MDGAAGAAGAAGSSGLTAGTAGGAAAGAAGTDGGAISVVSVHLAGSVEERASQADAVTRAFAALVRSLDIAYDLNGSYTAALLMLTAVPIVCAVAVLFIREPDLSATAE